MQADSKTQSTEHDVHGNVRWRTLFEDRHGSDAYERLRALLARPCVSFAQIAVQFGVSRECVRQWHLLVMPDAPRGHARQRLCAQLRQRRRLLEDPLFRSFFVHVRRAGSAFRLELLPATGGYRSRLARINGSLVALQDARRKQGTDPPHRQAFVLAEYTGPAEYLFVRLTDDEYLFLPSQRAASRTVLADGTDTPLLPFRNSFDALGVRS